MQGHATSSASHARFHLAAQVAGVIALVSAILIFPALWLVDSLVRERLLQRAIVDLERSDLEWMGSLQQDLSATEASITRFARVLSSGIRETMEHDEAAFHGLFERDVAGLWRSRRTSFDGRVHAGFFAPDEAVATPRQRSFFVQARRLTELYGNGARDHIFDNTWVLPAWGGEIVFWPGEPYVIYQAEADQDYRPTEWFQFATPDRNPEGEPRWTRTSFDPLPRLWMISLVAPYRLDGQWAGAVGHDIVVNAMFNRILPLLQHPDSHFLLLDKRGHIVLSNRYQARIEASAGQIRIGDLGDGPLASAYRLGQQRLERSRGNAVMVRSRRDMVFAGQLDGPDWTLLHITPHRTILRDIAAPLRWLRWGMAGSVLLALVASVSLVTRDTARRIRAEQAAHDSAEITEALLNATSDGAMLLDPEGRVLTCNAATCGRLGVPRDRMVGRNPFDWLPPALAADWRAWLAEVLRTAQPLRKSASHDGRTFEVVVHPIRDSHGNVARVGIFERDVTDLRDAEENRRRLEQRVNRMQKLESLGMMAGGIAHDFNNLLQAVIGHAELALQDIAPDSPAADSLREVVTAGRRAAAISTQMLAYSGKGAWRPSPIDLNQLLTSMTELIRSSLSRKARLHLDLTPNVPPIRADVHLLRQVVMNLSLNASEALEDREGDITLRTGFAAWTRADLQELDSSPDLPEGHYVQFEVEDTGKGMDHDTLARIFDPFFSTKFPGRGLGLPVVQSFARNHGGGVRVRSRPGGGTAFLLLLPVTHAEPPPPPAVRDPPPGWRGAGPILLVDDEPTVLSLGQRALADLGFEVTPATDGAAALDAVSRRTPPFRAVVLDLVLPGIGGDEVLAAIRRDQPGLPVIVASGYSRVDAEQRLRGLRFEGLVQKPYERHELARALYAALG